MLLNKYIKLTITTLLCANTLPVMAAKPVDLSHQSMRHLKSIYSTNKTAHYATVDTTTGINLEEVSRAIDMNQTTHTRIKQTYAGYPVWGGDAVVHTLKGGNKNYHDLMAFTDTSHTTLNGTVYEGLQNDLQNTPAYVFADNQANMAFTRAITDYENRVRAKAQIKSQKNQLMVYVDNNNKAHWAFYISAVVTANQYAAKPTYIMDAADFHIYKFWDDIKTLTTETANAGGYGGNIKTGKLSYDGLPGNLAYFEVTRLPNSHVCLLQNHLARVTDIYNEKVTSFPCDKPDPNHDNLYWNQTDDSVNGGYSPNNDVMFAVKMVTGLYQDWYHIPVLQKDGKPMLIGLITHHLWANENAIWSDEDEAIAFGDGGATFYPMTSVGITAHEMSHGFTNQHSRLIYDKQSGGMHESFSDMAYQAIAFYMTGKNDWMIGAELAKQDNYAYRYMDTPSKDCNFKNAGEQCSIDTAADYHDALDVHYSSGVFNRAFYLLATSKDWNIRKAFDVMVQANLYYWTPNSTFVDGACGVLKATEDYKYDMAAVVKAFDQVAVDTSTCV